MIRCSQLSLLTLCAILSGCASASMLPKNALDVNWDAPEGKTGWSSYQEAYYFPDTTRDQIYSAAKAGLGNADFALLRADIQSGIVIGQHGMTAHDWNIIAGVYFIKHETGYNVRVLVEGSKDLGFSGDATSGGWTGRILNTMRASLNR